ncbi:hypothetical protein LTR36_010004 [Oleoguttula mirabilis]|uniref:Uncharacterized protein n=1 Tax=Oleoguttula mirabilis TaxID=1507867 RepID=A0AAV9JRN1_9PEZI|nr:hypothetical protein LTR36_010004 [Oleoguttula mirabilis]
MYGADKIPDSWFEKVPGGFYKKKELEKKNKDERDKYGSGRRPSTNGSGSGRTNGGRDRRRSTGEATHRPSPEEDFYNERDRGDGRRRRPRDRNSYDGVEDDQHSGDDRHRRRNHGSSRRQRSVDDSERRYNDGHGGPPRDDRYDDRRTNGRPPYPQSDFVPPQSPLNPYAPAAAGAAAVGVTGTGRVLHPQSTPVSPTVQKPQPATNGKTGIANGYVPYADIYGHPNSPQSSNGSVQHSAANRAASPAPPPRGYHQNPYAQQAPTAAAAGAGAAYTGHAGPYPNGDGFDPRYDRERYDSRYDDHYKGYDEDSRPYSRSPPRHGRSRRDYSPSYDSHQDEGKERDRQARSGRRNDNPNDMHRTKSQGARGKSRRSEVGKAAVPIATGAAAGALDADVFEARERYLPPGQPGMIDPRKPLNAQLRRDEMPPPR